MGTKNIIIDTDMGPDCDDVGALAMLNIYANQGLCRILGVSHCTSNPYGAGTIDVINRYYGRPDVAIGTYYGEGFLTDEICMRYNRFITTHFPNRYQSEQPQEAVGMYRSILAAQPDGSVEVIGIGPMNNLSNLLNSGADRFSDLDGRELVRRKVSRLTMMAGAFRCSSKAVADRAERIGNGKIEDMAEFNVACDIPAAQNVAANWPTPKAYLGFEAGLIMTGLAVALGVVGFFWTPYSTTAMSASEKFDPPSLLHIFGTDNFGRDIFSRVMKGLGTTIGISSLVVLISGSVGILLGALTGYFGGIADEIVMRITDAVNGFPSILLTLVIISLLGSGRQNVIISLGIVFVPSYVRMVRSQYLKLRDADYIRRARLLGVKDFRILFVHILPNIFSVFWVSVMIGFNNAILAESGMSYLGIGVQPPEASLGNMLSDAQGYLQAAPWYALFVGMSIVWVVLGFSLFGEGIRRGKISE